MAQSINFDDALDYIFIANDSGSNTYLITNDVAANTTRMTSAISATAAAATAAAATTVAAIRLGSTTLETDYTNNAIGATVGVGAIVGSIAVGVGVGGGSSGVSAVSSVGGGGGGGYVDVEIGGDGNGNGISDGISITEATMLNTLWESSTDTGYAGSTPDVNSMTSISAAALVAENLYNSVAVDLGSMLINDSLLMDFNETTMGGGTSLYGDFINGTDIMATSNITSNVTTTDDDIGELLKMAATSVILGLMILVTIVGNVFVIAAIILERNLQNVANYLVASLAVADLFVACLVMPLGAVYEISQGWILGPELCDIWTSCDVLCCTASILHLLAIAADRYWAVTNIDYIHSRTSKRVLTMIFCVWTAAVVVSLAPQFGWKDPDYLQRIEQQKCMVSQDVAYQVFATCCTFYVPLMVILVLYWKIYQTARKRIHRRRPRPTDVTANNNQKRKRLRLRLGKFTPHEKKGATLAVTTGTSLGLVEGNSTNTVNTVEDTEFSSSNVDSKSRAGIEVTTNFCNPDGVPATSSSQITTVSHLVALANQQHTTATKSQLQQPEQQKQQQQPQKQEQQEQEQQQHSSQLDDEHMKNIPRTTSTTSKGIASPTYPSPTVAITSISTIITTATATGTGTPPQPPPITTATTISTPETVLMTSSLKTIVHNSGGSSSSSSSNQNRVSITLPITEVNCETTSTNINTSINTNTDTITIANTAGPVNARTRINAFIITNGIEVLEDPQLQEQLQQVQQHQQEQHQEQQQEQQHQEQQQQPGVSRSNTVGGGGGASTSNATTITSISALSPQTPAATTPASTGGGGGGGGGGLGTGSVVGPLTHPLSGSSTNPSNQVTPIPKPKQQQQQQLSSIANPMHKVTKRKETLEAKRERKAAKTLAIITGAFVVCWLPFFVMALMLPLCDECEISDSIASFFLWLGYFNSTLNPVIYTIFSPEFRQAFKRILFGAHRPVHYRSGKL